MSKVAVSPGVLRWASERSEQSEGQLAKKFPKIREWPAGAAKPTLRQLESFARATYTPFGFLFLEKPPREELPIPLFRTVADESPERPSPNLLETIQSMQRRQWWMREYLIEQGHAPLHFVGSIRVEEAVESLAQQMRRELAMEADWASRQRTWQAALTALRETMEQAGILVVSNGVVGNNTRRKLDVTEFRGFVLVDDVAPLVFVNNADFKAAQMFTLAHELAHVFLGSSAAFDLRALQPADDRTERMCNQAAAEFLVPQAELRAMWLGALTDPEPFQTIARRFKVSSLVAARRALDTQLISRDAFFRFYNAWKRDERRKAGEEPGGGDFYANQNLRLGKRFASAVIREARSGRLPHAQAYRLTGLHGRTFDADARRLGFDWGR